MSLSISIHALREEGDGSHADRVGNVGQFLSTPSARRATGFYCTAVVLYAISIHALREEGDTDKLYTFLAYEISIHALREEGDLPIRYLQGHRHISIHALREEGDPSIQ